MKKLTVIALAVCLLIAAALLWHHFEGSKLAGTWVVDYGRDIPIRNATTFSPDGSFVCQISGYTNGMIIDISGTFEMRDGVLISTETKDSQTNAVLPRVARARIVRFDDRELDLRFDGDKRLVVLRKESK